MYKSGLDFAIQKSGKTKERLVELLPGSADKLDAWIAGEVIPDEQLHDLALLLDVSFATMRGDVLDDDGSVFEPVMMRHYYNNDEDVDGYWGNAGFLAPNCEKSKWVSLSDNWADFLVKQLERDADFVVLPGMGMNGWIIFPKRLEAITMLTEAADHIEGDWDIDATDPVEGFSPAFVSTMGDPAFHAGDFEALEPFLASVSELAEEAGGVHALEEAAMSIDVYLINGRLLSISCWDGSSVEKLIDQIQFDGIDKGYFSSNENGQTSFIPVKNIAMIRCPVSFTNQ
jgi:hypothetical protein